MSYVAMIREMIEKSYEATGVSPVCIVLENNVFKSLCYELGISSGHGVLTIDGEVEVMSRLHFRLGDR